MGADKLIPPEGGTPNRSTCGMVICGGRGSPAERRAADVGPIADFGANYPGTGEHSPNPLKAAPGSHRAAGRKLLKGFFLDTPIRVIETADGAEAAALAVREAPDVILTDIRMPGVDGFEVGRRIREHERLRHVPIIAVTALALTHDRARIMESGHFDGFLSKPIQRADLFREMQRLLPRARPIDEANASGIPVKTDAPKPYFPVNLPELVRTIETELTPLWREVRELLIIDRIADFASDAKAAGEAHACEALIRYGSELENHARNFDIRRITVALDAYPEMAGWLAAMEGPESDDEGGDEPERHPDG